MISLPFFSGGPKGRVFPRVIAIIAILLAFTACKPAHIENLPPVLIDRDVTAEIHFIATRAGKMKNVSGSGSLQLTQPNGQSVVFDLAIAMQPPNHARFRAWKMGQAVLDLTVLPGEVWLETSQRGERKTQLTSVGDTAGRVTRALSLLSGGFFDDPNLTGQDAGDTLILTQQKPGDATITCWVDRKTLSPRKFQMKDSTGIERFTLQLEDYQDVAGIIWPRKVTAISAMGTVVVALDDIDLNSGLPEAAFIPPTAAEKLP